MPIVTTSEADMTLQLVVKKDLDLSGQFDVVADELAPSGRYLHDSPVDVAAWRGRGIGILVRVIANKLSHERAGSVVDRARLAEGKPVGEPAENLLRRLIDRLHWGLIEDEVRFGRRDLRDGVSLKALSQRLRWLPRQPVCPR